MRLPRSCIIRTQRSFSGRLLESQAVARPLLCDLIGDVPIIVAGRAVDQLEDDVGMPSMPSDEDAAAAWAAHMSSDFGCSALLLRPANSPRPSRRQWPKSYGPRLFSPTYRA